ncbi:GLE1-like protein-domain-containing protein [Protomyces lactucae-debilis]|uniref:mRNA export factor GLE1 n=1 Tax=Protomyces lactucae-debilis TaxID=2754530 RepID=A0A1Y2F3Q5_PROLT|nr:GLE1-like protein-domain-containing protein [Protomyces lactucae-debilis]ORY78511.1 GLE1-like protein-domain-containing protein [Protomyces lactucae-debilis]
MRFFVDDLFSDDEDAAQDLKAQGTPASDESGVFVKTELSSPLVVALDDHDVDAYAYDYDTEDSDVYDTSQIIPDAQTSWALYDRETRIAVREAALLKAHEVDKVAGLVQAWARDQEAQRRAKEESEWQTISLHLEQVSLAQRQEDEAMKAAWEARTQALELAVDEAISTAERNAEARKQRLLAIEAEKQRRIKEAEEESRRLILEEQRRQEEKAAQERARIQQEEERRAAKLAAEEKREADELQAQEDTRQAQAAAEAAQAEEARRQQAALASGPKFEAEQYQRLLEEVDVQVKQPIAKDAKLKDVCLRAKMVINRRIGTMTGSTQALKVIVQDIHRELTRAGETDPRCLRWLLNATCKKVVTQARREAEAISKAAYPMALLTILLVKPFPELKDLFLARLAKQCPWTIPYVDYDLSMEGGRKALGWKAKDNGRYTDFETYAREQKGVFTLFIAVTTIDLEGSAFHIGLCWRTISRLLNTQLENDELRKMSYLMLEAFLQLGGPSIQEAYGELGRQLLVVCGAYVGQEAVGSEASRLRIAVENIEGRASAAKFKFGP